MAMKLTDSLPMINGPVFLISTYKAVHWIKKHQNSAVQDKAKGCRHCISRYNPWDAYRAILDSAHAHARSFPNYKDRVNHTPTNNGANHGAVHSATSVLPSSGIHIRYIHCQSVCDSHCVIPTPRPQIVHSRQMELS